jgi:GIY-YIG catalytic domain
MWLRSSDWKNEKVSIEQVAVFVGLYEVGDHRPMTYEEFWEVPAYQEMKKYGMRGFVEEARPSVLWFDLTITDFYRNWKGKLVIEWPRPPIRWSRFANKARFPIHAIVEDSILHQAMPDWRDCLWSWAELRRLPNEWRKMLRQWRGIYHIFDQSDGKAYVGAAYGEDNILGRWEHYGASGHGGNLRLRQRSPDNFVFSILERVSPDLEASDVIDLEKNWKERLHTRAPFGLNDN